MYVFLFANITDLSVVDLIRIFNFIYPSSCRNQDMSIWAFLEKRSNRIRTIFSRYFKHSVHSLLPQNIHLDIILRASIANNVIMIHTHEKPFSFLKLPTAYIAS